MGDRKHSLNLIGPGRDQRPPVFFYTIYIDFKRNIISVGFDIIKKPENNIIEPTLVLTRVCRAWAMQHADTPTTLPELSFPIQPWWSEIRKTPHMRPLIQVVHRDP